MRPLRIGLIGYGRWGEKLARVIGEERNCFLAAIADLDLNRREAAAERYPDISLFDSGDALFRKTDDIDAIVIAVFPLAQPALIRAALALGRHVLAEKPLAPESTEAAALVELAEQRNRVLFVDHTPLHSPTTDALIDAIAAGHIGSISGYSAERLQSGRLQPGIDVIFDLMLHDFACFAAVFGAEPRTIEGTGISGRDGRLLEARVIFSLDQRVMAIFSASVIAERDVRRTVISGTKGRIERDDRAPFPLMMDIGGAISPIPTADDEPLRKVIRRFVENIRADHRDHSKVRAAASQIKWLETARQAIGKASSLVPAQPK